jgi:hypothetical protein
MQVSVRLPLVLVTIVACLLVLPAASANSLPQPSLAGGGEPPLIQGGEWSDPFWNLDWLLKSTNVDVSASHLLLRLEEPLHWTQTWTAHFAGGEFWHTEAISDSVRLAPNGPGQYFSTGTYTSTVFYAGRAVDWSSVTWSYLGIPGSLTAEYRTGNTPTPDGSWTGWAPPETDAGSFEFTCVYVFGSDDTECVSNMSGIESSAYIQYRLSFSSPDPAKTVALWDLDLVYGIHPTAATALSVPLDPVDLGEWASLILSSTVPAGTMLVVDIVAPDGTVLIADASHDDSLAGIEPRAYPAVQLRATFATSDTSLTPGIDLWGVRWSVRWRLWLPLVIR